MPNGVSWPKKKTKKNKKKDKENWESGKVETLTSAPLPL